MTLMADNDDKLQMGSFKNTFHNSQENGKLSNYLSPKLG